MNCAVRQLDGNGLQLSVHHFAPSERRGTILLLHGFADAGGTWSRVGTELAARGLEVWAPDMRGFGRSDRVPAGGYYHFPDYVADVAALARHIAADDLVVAGHSMGGTVACLYAGVARAHKLVLLEGIGPPSMEPSLGVARMRTWLDQLAAPRKVSRMASLDEAVKRLASAHPGVDRATLAEVVVHLTVPQPDGSMSWAMDALHRTTSPSIFRDDQLRPFLEAIACPVLFIGGGESGWHPPEERARLALLRAPPAEVVLEGAGHMVHWTRPREVAEAIAAFALDATPSKH